MTFLKTTSWGSRGHFSETAQKQLGEEEENNRPANKLRTYPAWGRWAANSLVVAVLKTSFSRSGFLQEKKNARDAAPATVDRGKMNDAVLWKLRGKYSFFSLWERELRHIFNVCDAVCIIHRTRCRALVTLENERLTSLNVTYPKDTFARKLGRAHSTWSIHSISFNFQRFRRRQKFAVLSLVAGHPHGIDT